MTVNIDTETSPSPSVPLPEGEGCKALLPPGEDSTSFFFAVNRAHEPGYIMLALTPSRKVTVQPSGARKLPVEKIGSNLCMWIVW